MEFPTYTIEGLRKLLFMKIKHDPTDVDYIQRIRNEIDRRPYVNCMCPQEQIFHIIKNTDFNRIQKVKTILDARYGHRYEIPSIDRLKADAEELLNKAAYAAQSDYESMSYATGGLKAERFITDGVLTLSLDFIVSGWEMDYDAVRATTNYSDVKYEGPTR